MSKQIAFFAIAWAIATMTTSYGASPDTDSRSNWSTETNGLRARLALRRWRVTNGSAIIATYIELQNATNVIGNLTLKLTTTNTVFRVTDKDGNEMPVQGMVFSGREFGTSNLVLPMDSILRVRIGPTGHGIGINLAAHLDLGSNYYWGLPNKEFYLSAVVTIEKTKSTDRKHWHGRIELPRVLVPMTSPKIDPEKLGDHIKELGKKILGNNGRESETAFEELSLINDPRVVPWYVKAVKKEYYGTKYKALHGLAQFDDDLALEGLKFGMRTDVKIGNVSRPELIPSVLKNVRHCAINALARSPHPKAKPFLLTFHNDESSTIRLSVVHAAAKMGTVESLAILKLLTEDKDPRVRNEAQRLWTLHQSDSQKR